MPSSIRDKTTGCLLCAMLLLAWRPAGAWCGVLPPVSSPEQKKSQEQIASRTQSVTVPLYVEHNRPFIDLEFTRTDGSVRKARFWVDTGGGGFIIVEPLARELGLKLGPEISEGGSRFATIDPPKVGLGGMPLNLDGARTSAAIGQQTMMPGVPAEGLLPGHVLMRYHVIFDYPGHKFTLAKSGTIKPRGLQLPSPINPRNGFPRIEAKIGEQSYGFLLDTGASFTMVSQELLNQWGAEHSEWPRVKGAVGAANMGLGPMEANGLLMRVPEFGISTFHLQGTAVISRPKGTFERYMSQMMTAPIVGAIGGNVWKAFRVEIDYANGVTYLEKKATLDPRDLDLVGLTLQPHPDGTYLIAGVSDQNNKEFDARIGDKLIRVVSLDVSGVPLANVIDSLRGRPGEKRSLLLERDGKRFEVKAPITRVL